MYAIRSYYENIYPIGSVGGERAAVLSGCSGGKLDSFLVERTDCFHLFRAGSVRGDCAQYFPRALVHTDHGCIV